MAEEAVATTPTAPAAAGAVTPDKGAATPATTQPDATTPASTGDTATTQAWSDDWREKMANGDTKKADRLKRYSTPDAVAEALIHVQNRISAGELRSNLPKNATPEQLATWRTENGIPEAPDKYDLKFEDGLKVSKEEMPHVDDFLKMAHANNYNTAQVKDAIRWHMNWLEQVQQQQTESDKKLMVDVTNELKTEWGRDYQENMNRIHGLMDMAPEEVRENLMRGRLADGTPIGSAKGVLKWLADRARAEDPSGTLTGTKGGDTLQTVGDRIKEIEEMIRSNRSGYNRDIAVQQELRGLYESRETLQRRHKAA